MVIPQVLLIMVVQHAVGVMPYKCDNISEGTFFPGAWMGRVLE
jgi:hypothetical protein